MLRGLGRISLGGSQPAGRLFLVRCQSTAHHTIPKAAATLAATRVAPRLVATTESWLPVRVLSPTPCAPTLRVVIP